MLEQNDKQTEINDNNEKCSSNDRSKCKIRRAILGKILNVVGNVALLGIVAYAIHLAIPINAISGISHEYLLIDNGMYHAIMSLSYVTLTGFGITLLINLFEIFKNDETSDVVKMASYIKFSINILLLAITITVITISIKLLGRSAIEGVFAVYVISFVYLLLVLIVSGIKLFRRKAA